MLTQVDRGPADDGGMTLIELVVGMTLLVLVMAAALNFFVGTTTQATRVSDQSATGPQARFAMTTIVGALRLADTPFTNAGSDNQRFLTAPLTKSNPPAALSSTEITFFSDLNTPTSGSRSGTNTRSAPVEVDFTLAGGRLTETQWDPCTSSAPPGCAQTPSGFQAAYPSIASSTTQLLSGSANTAGFVYCTDDTDPSTSCTQTTSPAAVAYVLVTLDAKGQTGDASQPLQSAVAITGAMS